MNAARSERREKGGGSEEEEEKQQQQKEFQVNLRPGSLWSLGEENLSQIEGAGGQVVKKKENHNQYANGTLRIAL